MPRNNCFKNGSRKTGILCSNSRAQASFEYLAVFGMAFLILIPMVYVFQSYSASSSVDIERSALSNIGEDIINTAEAAYYMGYPSRLTLKETFPEGIIDMRIDSDLSEKRSVLTFGIRDGSEMIFESKVAMNGTFSAKDFSGGQKSIRIDAKNGTMGNYVHITFE